MSVELLTEHHLEFLSLTGGCAALSMSTFRQNATLLEITCHSSFIHVCTYSHFCTPNLLPTALNNLEEAESLNMNMSVGEFHSI